MNRKLGIIGSSEVGSGHLSGACSARIPDPLGSWERQKKYNMELNTGDNVLNETKGDEIKVQVTRHGDTITKLENK